MENFNTDAFLNEHGFTHRTFITSPESGFSSETSKSHYHGNLFVSKIMHYC